MLIQDTFWTYFGNAIHRSSTTVSSSRWTQQEGYWQFSVDVLKIGNQTLACSTLAKPPDEDKVVPQ